MIDLQPPLRRATATDAPALADFINYAGEGMPLHIWTQMATGGQDPWAIGRTRMAVRADAGKCFVVDEGAGAVAALIGYVTPLDPEVIAADEEPMFVPLIELENLAPSTWYVNVLAAYPENRGKGLGARLLALAEEIARGLDVTAMSIIVASGNTGARRLYERTGYVETARRPVVKGDWDCDSDEWVLLVKRL